MKLSFSTLGCPDWKWGDILAAAKDLEYDGIEVRGVNDQLYVPRIFAGREETVKEELTRLNLEMPCITSAIDLHNLNNRANNLKAGQEYVDCALSVGTKYIRVLGDYHPEPRQDVDAGLVKEVAAQIGAYAREKGVVILIETNGYFANTERLARLLEEIGNPAVAALWDMHHPYRFMGEPPQATVENLKGYIKHVHLKDSVMEGDQVRYRMMGAGDMPIEACVTALTDTGYDGYYSLEWTKRWNLALEEPGIAFANFVSYMSDYR
ncbi:MAG: sugar phosphate isomerase/epimerase family protein [Christensenellales bacterium]